MFYNLIATVLHTKSQIYHTKHVFPGLWTLSTLSRWKLHQMRPLAPGVVPNKERLVPRLKMFKTFDKKKNMYTKKLYTVYIVGGLMPKTKKCLFEIISQLGKNKSNPQKGPQLSICPFVDPRYDQHLTGPEGSRRPDASSLRPLLPDRWRDDKNRHRLTCLGFSSEAPDSTPPKKKGLQVKQKMQNHQKSKTRE